MIITTRDNVNDGNFTILLITLMKQILYTLNQLLNLQHIML